MSREVRRVPLRWRHPIEDNPHWLEQKASALFRGDYKPSLLRPPDKRFRGLFDGFPEAMTDWEQDGKALQARTGRDWAWAVAYHLTGYVCTPDHRNWLPVAEQHNHTEPQTHPRYVWDEQAQGEVPIVIRDEQHLFEVLWGEHEKSRPKPENYMPVFDLPEEDLGWCLYETVSEGTPVTPVFATAAELVDHLVTVGQDWKQQPMRRSAAEVLVGDGGTVGTVMAIGRDLYRTDEDADLLRARLAVDETLEEGS